MKNFLLALIASTLFCLSVRAQKLGVPPETIQFYLGQWYGTGQFSNGKKIEANMKFETALDGAWFVQTHTDVAPATFKSTAFWGVDPETQQPIAHLFDNSNGHRKFDLAISGNQVVLSCSVQDKQRGLYYQRFVYEKTSGNSFDMAFEISKDAREWRMVDKLTFLKN